MKKKKKNRNILSVWGISIRCLNVFETDINNKNIVHKKYVVIVKGLKCGILDGGYIVWFVLFSSKKYHVICHSFILKEISPLKKNLLDSHTGLYELMNSLLH